MPTTTLCEGIDSPLWFFFNPSIPVPTLVHWADFSALFFSLILALFVIRKNPRGLANRVLFATLIAFVVWVFSAVLSEPTNSGNITMFTWALAVLVEPLVYGGSLYLLYVLIDKKDIPFTIKMLFGLFYLPVILLAPTAFTLEKFNIATCLATEGLFSTLYVYSFEASIVLLLVAFAIRRYLQATEEHVRQEILYLTLGTVLFLFAFSWGNIFGSLTEDWAFARIGLFGAPIFAGFLVYTIVKFGTFSIKILSSVALILTLLALLFVGLFV